MADTRAQIILSAVDRTAAAFDSARRNLGALQTSAQGIAARISPIIGTVGLLGSALSAVSFRSIVSGIDALNDLSDSTGSTIENISALEQVAGRTGTTLDTVGTSLLRLNQTLNAAKPDSSIAESFKAIGLNAEELKRLDPAEALRQTAVALAGFADDADKARLVQILFGRSVREIGSFLKDLAEQGRLNGKVTGEQALEVEKFNKQLFELQTNIRDTARGLVSELIPGLNRFFEALKQDGAIGAGLAQRLGIDEQGRLEAQAAITSASIGRVVAQIEEFDDALRKDPSNRAYRQRIEELRADFTRLQADAQATTGRLKELANFVAPLPENASDALSRRIARGEGGPRPSVGPIADPSEANRTADRALANLRKVVDGNLRAVSGSLKATQDALQFNEQFSRAIYERGLQSLESFYADQDRARTENIEAIRRATAEEIAERQRLLDSPLLRGADRQGDRQDIQNQIADARQRLAEAEREADQASRLSVQERAQAVESLRGQVTALDAQIRDLASGSTVNADLLDIAERVRAASQLFVQGGASQGEADARAAQLGNLLEVQRQFNVARASFAKLSNDAAAAEERLLLASQANGDGLLETEDKVRALREGSLRQLDDLISKTRELASVSPEDGQLQAFLSDLELQAARLKAVLDPRKLRLDAAADTAARDLTDGLRSAVVEGGNLTDIFNDLDRRLTGLVFDELVGKPFEQAIANALKGAGGQGLGENIFGKLFEGLGFGGGGFTVPGFAGGQIGVAANAAGDAAEAAASATATASLTALGAATSGLAVPALTAVGTTATVAAPALNVLAGAAGAASTALALISGNSVGSAGGDALGAFITAAGFRGGGYTGNAGEGEAAGVVHGKEFVFSAPAVRRLGVDTLERLHDGAKRSVAPAALRGYQDGGFVGMPSMRGGRRGGSLRAGGGQTINFSPTFVLDRPASRETQDQVLMKAFTGAQRAVGRNG